MTGDAWWSGWDDENACGAWLQDVYIGHGWMRQLPPSAVGVIAPLVAAPRTVDDLGAELAGDGEAPDGWRSPAWEPLTEWTDQALTALRTGAAPGEPTDEDEDDAETVMAQEAAARSHRVARMDRYSRALGVRPVRTLGDLLDFLVAARLLHRHGSGGAAVLELDPAAPLPGEVLPLSPAEQAFEDQVRWQALHEHTAQAIMALFGPDTEQPSDSLLTTLQHLAAQLGTDVESARAGALVLVAAGDFTATRDLERAAADEVFELVVDWDLFARQRLILRLARPDEFSS